MKRILIVFLILAMGAPALVLATGGREEPASAGSETGFNATGFPIVDETVTITVAGRKRNEVTIDDYNQWDLFQDLEELTNVHIEWDLTPQSAWVERRNLIFASLDLPDAFYGIFTLGGNDVVTYGEQGLLIPLEGLIDRYGDNTRRLFAPRSEYRNMITAPDGHIYALSVINEQYENAINDATFINKAWLDRLGLDVPQTPDEFRTVLRAFRDNDANGNGDPGDEIPFSFRYPQAWSFPMGSFGISDNWQMANVDEDGNVFFIPTTENFREYIRFMNSLYSEGLIDIEAFTHNNQIYRSKYRDGVVGVFVEWQLTGRLDAELAAQYVPLPLLNTGHDKTVTLWQQAQNSLGAFAITHENQHPEATLRWIDVLYGEDWSLQSFYGPFGVTIERTADGMIRQLATPEGVSYEEFRHGVAPGAGAAFALTRPITASLAPTPTVTEKRALFDLYSQWAPEEYWHVGLASLEENEELSNLDSDIIDYSREQAVLWITEGGVDEGWANYQQTIRNMGLDRMMEIRQRQYDRVMGRM